MHDEEGLPSSPGPPRFHISSADPSSRASLSAPSAESAEGTCHSTTAHPCPWLPRAAEGTQLSALHGCRRIGAWARCAVSSCLACTPTERVSPAPHLAHHFHQGVGWCWVQWAQDIPRQNCSMAAGDQTQTSKQPLQAASLQCARHMRLSPSQQLWADSSLAQPSLVQHTRPTEDRGCRQGLSITAAPTHAGTPASCISPGHSERGQCPVTGCRVRHLPMQQGPAGLVQLLHRTWDTGE